jgi:alkylhydroperoxidase family enzyme
MSRIPPVEDVPFPQDESLPFASMSTLFRTMGHRPELMQQSMQLLQTAMRGGTVDPRLKELLAVRVSQVNHCFY